MPEDKRGDCNRNVEEGCVGKVTPIPDALYTSKFLRVIALGKNGFTRKRARNLGLTSRVLEKCKCLRTVWEYHVFLLVKFFVSHPVVQGYCVNSDELILRVPCVKLGQDLAALVRDQYPFGHLFRAKVFTLRALPSDEVMPLAERHHYLVKSFSPTVDSGPALADGKDADSVALINVPPHHVDHCKEALRAPFKPLAFGK